MNNAEQILGIDWGTTNRRAYLLDAQGTLLSEHVDSEGILAAGKDFTGSLGALLAKMAIGTGEVILSGMIGSRNGWREAPYLTSETMLTALPGALMSLEAPFPGLRCRIVPGYRVDHPHGAPDVMRGEETQVFGALKMGAAEGWFLLPGTHSKWVRVAGGRVVDIITFMTGELFGLLSQHGTLAPLMQEKADMPEAFEAGLCAAQHGGFTHAAFGCRALVVTDAMPAAHAHSYLSGLLIGAELAEVRRRDDAAPGQAIQVIGSPELTVRYLHALDFFDMRARQWPADAVYLAALRALAGR